MKVSIMDAAAVALQEANAALITVLPEGTAYGGILTDKAKYHDPTIQKYIDMDSRLRQYETSSLPT